MLDFGLSFPGAPPVTSPLGAEGRPIISKRTLTLASLALVASAVAVGAPTSSGGDASKHPGLSPSTVVPVSEVEWEPLNPARGDQSPKAGTLWGDRNGDGPTGFLVEFVDGFSSPPHIHNVSYRGVVLRGLIHNDDPDAADMWMPAGSFWTQPKGEVHITAASGSTNVAYIEIEEGPYLVLPTEDTFDSGERPINVDASNLVWIDPPGAPASAPGSKVAYVWGNPQDGLLHGALVKLPAGFNGTIRSRGPSLRAVVIQGRLEHQGAGETVGRSLDPGSYFSSGGESEHRVSCEAGSESLLYLRIDGKFEVVSGS